MKKNVPLLLGLILLGAGALDAHAQDRTRETMIDEHFKVSEGGTLEVNASDADVKVTSGKANDVHVRIALEGRDMDLARDYYKRQRIEVSQDGNTVRITSDPERGDYGWRNWRNHPQIEYLVTIPEAFNADVRSSDGDLTLDRLRGNVRLQTSDGDISTGAIKGGSIEIRSSDGDIELGPLSGNTIELVTSDGNLELGEVAGDRVVIRTSDGDISTGAITGEADVKTSDGSISVTSYRGSTLSLRTSDGSIRVDRLAAESARVHTSDGEISVAGADGDLEVKTSSGDIWIELNNARTVTARASDGDITIVAPRGHRADLSLHGEDVHVARAHSFDGDIDEDRAEGRINGGGPMIRARTSDGSVRIEVR